MRKTIKGLEEQIEEIDRLHQEEITRIKDSNRVTLRLLGRMLLEKPAEVAKAYWKGFQDGHEHERKCAAGEREWHSSKIDAMYAELEEECRLAYVQTADPPITRWQRFKNWLGRQ